MAEGQAREQGVARARGLAKWVGLGVVTLLAACQVVPKGRPGPLAPPPTATRPDPIGPSLPSDAERHRVALLVPLTGPNAGVGTSISNAANLAVLDTGGQKIRVTMYDTGAGAATAAQRAIAEGNRVILGPLLAEDVRIVAPIARAAKVPLIAFSNDTGVAGNGTFVMGYAPAQSIGRVVDYAKSKGLTKFAGLMPVGLYGQRSSTALLRAVESNGGQVVSVQTFDRTPGSVKAAITKMNAASPYQAVLIADSGRTAVAAIPSIRAGSGRSAQILGTELWNTETGMAASPALKGAWFASVSNGLYSQLAAKYRVRFGRSPYRLASLGYDAVLLVTRIAGEWRVGTAFPQSALSDAGGFSGIDGAFRFNREGIAERALEVQQAGPTGFTVISPAPRGF
ncbi:penicillin-binding protein activator [Sphingomonas sp.]|uniref:penicillin-binding protein activator n=1 Tax=Sphingomonas sp. TaxID=28214 RepID=UPI0025E62190|nr:penicillin-binding protein activator [Sphingomonas sp.]